MFSVTIFEVQQKRSSCCSRLALLIYIDLILIVTASYLLLKCVD